MDLVSSIRKTGSRGGVNFNWEDVASSAHRENYLGHSLKAPVGRWQQGRDLNWYAKADATDSSSNETAEEKAARQRKEELKKIKEAEEDALARALGLPVAPRNVSGANAVDVGESRIPARDDQPTEPSKSAETRGRPSRHHDDHERRHTRRHRSRSRDRNRRRHPSRSASRDRDRDRARRRDRSPRGRDDGHYQRPREDREGRREQYRRRSYSRERDVREPRGTRRRASRSRERLEPRREHRSYRPDSRDGRRSRSPPRRRHDSLERK
ncbi:hypothetical protein F5Y16DRAFT_358460 [Xylariaceae sp. FL0255]|nr:hypothetical protein F5Y16DRAFT_358460 [Xylariaceae sp. FL0255]